MAAALVGAITWNLITWRLGIPSSSSHALIGGLIGSVIAASGTGALKIDGILGKVLVPLVSSPILGVAIGFTFMVVLLNVFRRVHPRKLNDRFRRLQVVSAAFMAFSHGSNDAQKTMGIMTLALVAGGVLPHDAKIPLWVILLAASAISFGTAAGGWRIIRTMGQRVVKLDPVHGFAAETTAATIILDGVVIRDAGLDHPRHLVGDHGRRLERPVLGGPLGRRRQHRDRLDPDDPGIRGRRLGRLGTPQPGPLRRPRREGTVIARMRARRVVRRAITSERSAQTWA